jgi:hypothetical protein
MKKLLTILLTIFSFFINGQEKRYKISDVIEIENSSTNDLYSRGRQWFISSFNDSNRVIQLDDNEKGIIIGKGYFEYEPNISSGRNLTRGKINFIISLQFKDGRYRYILKDFTHYGKTGTKTDFGVMTKDIEYPYGKSITGSQKWKSKIWKDIKEVILTKSEEIIGSLKKSMKIPSIVPDDDW